MDWKMYYKTHSGIYLWEEIVFSPEDEKQHMNDKSSNQPTLGVLPRLEDKLPEYLQPSTGWSTDKIIVNGQMLTVIFPEEDEE